MDANGIGLDEIGLQDAADQFTKTCQCGNRWQGSYCDDTCLVCGSSDEQSLFITSPLETGQPVR